MAKIMIVDDSLLMRNLVKQGMEALGHRIVVEARDGHEALSKYLVHKPDLVTMDIVMPKRSGIDAVRGIIENSPGACVVMCSALGQETLVMEALQAGAKDFIVKPFKPDNVVATLKKVLEKNDES